MIARIECFLVNFADPDGDGLLWLRKGCLGEVSFRNGTFVCGLRGLAQNLAASVVEVVSPVCRHRLGDSRCGVDLAALAGSGTVASVTSNRVMTVAGSFTATSDWFQNGEVLWPSGANVGLTHEVERYEDATAELILFLAAPIALREMSHKTPVIQNGASGRPCSIGMSNAVTMYPMMA